jgi:hypothetical protein
MVSLEINLILHDCQYQRARKKGEEQEQRVGGWWVQVENVGQL